MHFYHNGNMNACQSTVQWWPGIGWDPYGDGGNGVRDQISNAYKSILGRYAEQGGLEAWYWAWTSTGFGPNGTDSYITDYYNQRGWPNVTIYQMVLFGGMSWPPNYNSSWPPNGGSGEYDQIYGPPGNPYSPPRKHIVGGTGNCPVLGCTDSNAGNYNSSAQQDDGSCWYHTPSASLNSSPSSIISGGSVSISWSTNYAQSVYITNIGSVSSSGSTTISPISSNQTWVLTAYGYGNGGSTSRSTSVTVYQQPNVNLYLSSSSIQYGSSTTLSWTTTGDASSASLSPGFGSVPLNSNTTVAPTTTTTYTISVSGSGGSDSASITLTVIPAPTASLTANAEVNWGDGVPLSWSTTNASNVSIHVVYYIDGSNVTQSPISGLGSSGSTTHTPNWSSIGGTLEQITFTLHASNGSITAYSSQNTAVEIDTSPNLIVIPPSEDLYPEEEPVNSPISDSLLVDDIDIPVEVKASQPIKVDINEANNWQDVRQI